ncbi:MAG: NAD(P)/FAD-dependent oxidoreductase [Gammaproteobacteria bacterium]|nr:NAD(P)/FAD-dependent oxidoreductase [Gammaproteobacteria bacterium]
MEKYDVIIIGAGAAGLMCAIEAGKRGKSVCVLDHAKKPGKKLLISGGGKCNFTNYTIDAANYLSQNPHFCKSALARFSQWDFIAMIEASGIAYHEREHGQLFCDNKAKEILDMLLAECNKVAVSIHCNRHIKEVKKEPAGFVLTTDTKPLQASALVIASGGLSIPKMGATSFGLQIAEQFGLGVINPRAGLVPFTLHDHDKAHYEKLSGVSVDARITAESGQAFREALLFTHRGLSGPASLQISSYWMPGQSIEINLLPELDVSEYLLQGSSEHPKQSWKKHLSKALPRRLIEARTQDAGLEDKNLNQLTDKDKIDILECLQHWRIKPNGTEGYRTAEVTVGGVDTNEISSKTMQSNKVEGLYFIGEVLDVTGHLGGYNFQWAWASGYVAGQMV